MSSADSYKLKETPEETMFPALHYVYVQAIGPFMETAPKSWGFLHSHISELKAVATIEKYLSMYQLEPEPLYRAGVSVTEKPATLPEGFSYEYFAGGKYNKFELTGSYRHMPEACGRVMEIVKDSKMAVNSAGYFLENYLNDPRVTPENELRTDILVPIQ
jgi:predicted transcriptional regulator YdeE